MRGLRWWVVTGKTGARAGPGHQTRSLDFIAEGKGFVSISQKMEVPRPHGKKVIEGRWMLKRKGFSKRSLR